MSEATSFQPDWVSPPGETIKDILTERALNISDFSEMMGFSQKSAKDLLHGKLKIDNDVANSLETIFGASKEFWINRERNYRLGLERYAVVIDEQKGWLKKLPTRDMVKYRWISPSSKWKDKYRQCLDFFGVYSVDEWYKINNDKLLMTAFRTSSSFDHIQESVITWLRQGERLSSSSNFAEWNPEKFKRDLINARALTVEKDPNVFIPKLQALFAKSGVSIVVSPTPSGCRASGATCFTSDGYAMMMLSFRYLSDDHFWFTVFHEAGHLLLHGDKALFLEGLEESCSVSDFEEEANSFSGDLLVPKSYQKELRELSLKNWRQIPRFAKKIGIAPGIVVGQLQHLGIVGHSQLNRFKVRYKWANDEKNTIV
ncbi:ImmA/IrrE family metallo-endopeptidase [Marinobacterium sedimentorum]|uniref:ImmA/IrrE family metallo-endopeptidase n=1 Tax=Marinobacterium sedimentorum TaxID=2927804 RepID=UPI0020C66D91|nr:ImmA/IrrE family metallo-endopeptidase [Marinobacterium sedimentorum]MCP8687282.1 ImmA/IrrE family metallo-endopeptidase [Marinobacterium sedimentorum]